MKVVVQNGANHCLSRRDAEAVVRRLPAAWSSNVRQVLLAAGNTLSTSFHPKEGVLCLYCPAAPTTARDKNQAVLQLLRGAAGAAGVEVPDGLMQECLGDINGAAA